jgi:hypothetical protein
MRRELFSLRECQAKLLDGFLELVFCHRRMCVARTRPA